MIDRPFDPSTMIAAAREAFAPVLKAQQEGFKNIERLARLQYAVAGDVLENGLARVNAASLAVLALAPARPKNAELSGGLSNDSTVKWDANKERDLAGYEIVWRDTTSPVWTKSRSVGNVTTYTLKGMSKDNYFFGVRAVDKDGNRSPATYPAEQGSLYRNKGDGHLQHPQ